MEKRCNFFLLYSESPKREFKFDAFTSFLLTKAQTEETEEEERETTTTTTSSSPLLLFWEDGFLLPALSSLRNIYTY